MPLEAPQLDTRTFEDLLAEARLRIPRYTPEWTDFNDSDPGITLVQLFAWLSELMLFQMNKVPERNYIKFLQLLDMELEAAQPARTHLTFSAEAGAARIDPVPRGTSLAAAAPDGGPPILFETEEGLDLVPIPLADIQVYDGSTFVSATAANAASGTSFRPLGWIPQVGSSFYLGFAETHPGRREDPTSVRRFPQVVRLRVTLPATASESPPPRVDLAWEYRSARAPQSWRQLNVFSDETRALTREGYLLLEGPADAVRTTEGTLNDPRYWLRCRLTAGRYDVDQVPEIDLLRPNTVPAVNLQTVREEVLGLSEGHPQETFELAQRPVERQSLELWTERDGLEPQRWQAVDDLLASGPEDPHFRFNATAGQVRFGDGTNGRIPLAGARIVARRYRWGGGQSGNVGRGQITGRPTALNGVQGVTNETPAEGGRDEQTVEELKLRAPGRLRHRSRAVTAADYSALASEVGGVAKATTLAGHHPDFPEVVIPGAVTVIIVPQSRDNPPVPSTQLLGQTSQALDRSRLLTTELYVRAPTYVAISVHARVVAAPFEAADHVAAKVRDALDTFLDPLTREFGLDLFPTRFYDVILGAAGVNEVVELQVDVDHRPHERLTEPIELAPNALFYSAPHRIRVVPAEDR